MKQIIPFVKDINLGTRIAEVTSISMEHDLKIENNDSVVGVFTIGGKYKINEISINEESFKKDIPFDITLDDKYNASLINIDIDDFYYEIVNEELLRVHIDVLVDNLEYIKEDKEEIKETDDNNKIIDEIKKEDNYNILDERVADDVAVEEKEINNDVSEEITSSIHTNFDFNEEKYVMYKVHIIRENESLQTIKDEYNITEEELKEYNSLDNISNGTKLIIPLKNE